MGNNLAIKLRSGTQQAHTNAENVGFMKCFLKGVVTRECFAKFLSNLYFVYSELEAGIEQHKQHPVLSVIYFPELKRQAALEKDMVFYYGNEWRNKISPSPAAQTYVTRLRQLSTHEPSFLLGHAYTRYMGDLSGGQMLQKIAQSTLQLSGYEGTSFYNFELIPDKKAFKDKYRLALDAVPIDDKGVDRIVAEANYAFSLNMQMVKDLESFVIAAIGEARYREITNHHNPGSTEFSAAH
ncbi:heme oxygenase [Richelia sinica FACHB-800]|uniref:heme oxygenase (biliverdin-producing) n=1 Tax=Richelia sinica FACHB-800 TaxID=1357546 RepID=A0A975T993_9NOST|nr:heme oxygenase (biliverdin-producing) [Richelia sinica]MBD2663230.1 heme oxygenase (biliverdin-producing) [Richelia sinica FACHB-800]QXE24384.1 heme oxygenase [Richelia sinica FACHB-800]